MCIRDRELARYVNHNTDASWLLDLGSKKVLENLKNKDAVSYTHLDVYKRQASNSSVT